MITFLLIMLILCMAIYIAFALFYLWIVCLPMPQQNSTFHTKEELETNWGWNRPPILYHGTLSFLVKNFLFFYWVGSVLAIILVYLKTYSLLSAMLAGLLLFTSAFVSLKIFHFIVIIHARKHWQSEADGMWEWRLKELSNDLRDKENSSEDLKKYRREIERFEQDLLLFKNRQVQGYDLAHLGSTYSTLGEMRKALECYEQAWVIHREAHDHDSMVVAFLNMVQLLRKLNELDRALELAREAARVFTEIKSPYAQKASQFLAKLEAGVVNEH